MNNSEKISTRLNRAMRTYSIPLILGVITALVFANLAPEAYLELIEEPIRIHGVETKSLAWLIEDIFMVFFFGTAGIEIVKSLSPGGPLNPIKKAVTPLMATVGGVLGPVVVFFALNHAIGDPAWSNGWGICTATDIALAWLIAKLVFGADHPAVSFLLLLAVADDAIGLAIIAIFYPTGAVQPIYLLFTALGMAVALLFRHLNVRSFWPYLLIPGVLSWIGLYKTGVSPALALVFIVPFFPTLQNPAAKAFAPPHEGEKLALSSMELFEENIGPFVDYGLFFFGFCNAGVEFSSMSTLTIIIMASLIVGKTLGISLFALLFGKGLGFGLPEGMSVKDVFVAGLVGGIGLTVALFVTQAAYTDVITQGAAKMGALFSIFAGILALALKPVLYRNPKAKKAPRPAAEKTPEPLPETADV